VSLPLLRELAWQHESVRLTAASFVDNLWFVAHNAYNATKMGQLFEEQLNERWGQQIKPSSRETLNVSGNEDDELVSLEWSQVSRMKVLGQFIQNDGGIDYDFSEASKPAWASFWGNVGDAHARRLPLITRPNSIARATLPTLAQRVARWPLTRDKVATQDV